MKSRDSLVRLRKFQAEERRRRVVQIEAMVAEFARMSAELDREIAAEEQRSGNSDPSHFAYSTYARSTRARRDNLKQSADELVQQLEQAKAAFEEAMEDVLRAQTLEGRDKSVERAEQARDAVRSALG